MSDVQRPDPSFVSSLEWQLRTELRRSERFEKKQSLLRRFRGVAAIVVAGVVGFAAASASQRFEDRERFDLLVTRAEVQVDLAEARRELAAGFLDEVLMQVEAGADNRETLILTEFEFRQIDSDVKRAQLELRELRESGRDPSNKLTAPLVGGIDYVTARLQLDFDTSNERLEMIQSEFERTAARVDGGADNKLELGYFEMEVANARIDTESYQKKLEIRRDFLSGRITAQEVVEITELSSARQRLEESIAHTQLTHTHLEELTGLFKTGQATKLDLMQAEFQVKEAETDQKLAELELDYLRSRVEK